MSELRKLIETVETGTISDDPRHPDEFAAFDTDGIAFSEYGMDAYLGSIDAARSLHEALVPDWSFCLHAGVCRLDPSDMRLDCITAFSDITARAWLMATLRAYEAAQLPAKP